jgi:hypothetical protein
MAIAASWMLSAQQTRPTVLSRLLWFDRSGMRLNGIGPVADHGNLELSPDGTRVAVAVARRAGEPRDLWIYDTNTGARTQFTSEPPTAGASSSTRSAPSGSRCSRRRWTARARARRCSPIATACGR